MLDGFFNHDLRIAEDWWERRDFLHNWRRMYAVDRRWVPMYDPLLRATLRPGAVAHLARQHPTLIHAEAMPGEPNYSGEFRFTQMQGAFMEQPVGATVLLNDPRRRDRTGYLALLKSANHVESLERLMGTVTEQAWRLGVTRLVGPVGLSPHLAQGALLDSFDVDPPLDSPYNPPYVPELLAQVMDPLQSSRLYYAAPVGASAGGDGAGTQEEEPAQLRPVSPADYPQVLPTLLGALDGDPALVAPDGEEATFLLSWWGTWPLWGWVAEVRGAPVGVALLQSDLAPALRRARGGRNPLWRLWLHWRSRRRTRAGRLLALAVLPAYRRQGIGRQLWQAALAFGREQRWRHFSVGPVADASVGAEFLLAQGAAPRQHYQLYEMGG